MKKNIYTFLTTSTLLATLLLSGCGEVNTGDTKQPFDGSKLNRTTSVDTDWTWFVGVDADVTQRFSLHTDFFQPIPKEIKHFQQFYDIDDDASTGFSGANGWEIEGADYLIEDGNVFKSLSNTEWKWDYVGKMDFQFNQPASLDHKIINLSSPDFNAKAIFNTAKFNIMIESYDANWGGDYPTITGIEVKNTKIPDAGIDKKAIEDKIHAQYKNSSFVVSINFTPDDKKALVLISFRGIEKLYAYDLSDPSNPQIIQEQLAPEYENLFIFHTIKVMDSNKITFQTLEEGDIKYNIIYDYATNTQISKTPVDDVAVRLEKFLDARAIDNLNDGEIDHTMVYTYSFDEEGVLKQKVETLDFVSNTSYYDDNGDISKIIVDYGRSRDVITFTYTYNAQGQLISKTATNTKPRKTTTLYTYTYNDKNQRISVAENGKTTKTFTYDAQGQVSKETHFDSIGDIIDVRTFVYDDEGDVFHEIIDKNNDGTIDEKIYYTYKKINVLAK
jgi:YD repeat-containing protein